MFVRLTYEAGDSATVELTREDVAIGEVRSGWDRRHDLDDQDRHHCATTAQWTTQWMYVRHIPAFDQHRYTMQANITIRKNAHGVTICWMLINSNLYLPQN